MAEDRSVDASQSYALYPLRLGLALVFIVYGWNKLTDLSGTQAMFDGWGIPLPGVAALLVGIAEFFGGFAILTGVLTRFSSTVLSVVMATAIFVVKFDLGFVGGWAFDIALLAGLVTLVVNGAGRPTLFTILGREELDPEQRVLSQWGRARSGT